jgi:hypothetical protein
MKRGLKTTQESYDNIKLFFNFTNFDKNFLRNTNINWERGKKFIIPFINFTLIIEKKYLI